MQSFIDTAKIIVKAGRGGDGAVSLRHEKYVPKGGPDGGDGGNGGDIYFQADSSLNTLYPFRFKKQFKSAAGERGGKSNKHGRSAEDLYINVPIGTVIDMTDTVTGETSSADLASDQQIILAAKGGRGGKGNSRFKSSRQQTPRFATEGEPGQEVEVRMELKLLADVGLVGQPNAGKSSMLAKLTKARPAIANYPFTTIEPNLGIAEYAGETYVIADIPGLIEGASEGKGLGGQFLKHVERTSVLFHLVSLDAQESSTPLERFEEVLNEMRQFNPDLLKKMTVIILTKADLADEIAVNKAKKAFAKMGYKVLISNPEKDDNYNHISAAGLELLKASRANEKIAQSEANESVALYNIDNLPRVYKK